MPKMTDEELVEWATKEFKDARAHSNKWRNKARTCYDYKAGEQWSAGDKSKMKAEDRPIITFNRVGVFVRAVVGLESSNRQEMVYKEQEVGDSAAVGIANQTSKWARTKSDSEYEQSAAFEDLVTCGMGWVETLVDFDQDLDGKIREEQEDPLRCYWDSSARKPNLADARWVARLKGFDREEFDRKFPKHKSVGAASILGEGDFFGDVKGEVHNADAPAYQSDGRGNILHTEKIRVLEFQYHDTIEIIRFDLGDGKGLQEASVEDFNKLKKRLEVLGQATPRNVKQMKRHYYRAFFTGKEVLEHEELPIEATDKIPDFTLQCMTGYQNRNEGTWDGLVAGMIDPQNWANKYFSQMHDLMNSGVKGGLWFETSAVKDPVKFEQEATKPGAAIEFEDGALSGKKVIQPSPPSMPPGLPALHGFAIEALPSVSGLNPELLGLAGRDQPGILEAQRKQAGLTILATLFDALRRYRLRQGRVLLWYIREFMPDDRIARIVGEQNARYIPKFREAGAEKFDINVGDAPTSPHMKERVFAMFMQIIPLLGDKAALILPILIQYSPFPQEVVQPLMKLIQESSQPKPEQLVAQRMQLEQAMAEVEKTQSETLLNRAKAEAEADGIALKDTKIVQDLMTDMAEISSQIEIAKMTKDNGGSNG